MKRMSWRKFIKNFESDKIYVCDNIKQNSAFEKQESYWMKIFFIKEEIIKYIIEIYEIVEKKKKHVTKMYFSNIHERKKFYLIQIIG